MNIKTHDVCDDCKKEFPKEQINYLGDGHNIFIALCDGCNKQSN